MGISKVNYGDNTLIDLTADTVTAADLKKGVTAHDKSGVRITGTAETKLRSTSVTPSKLIQNITPGDGYDGLSSVTVGAIPDNYVDTSDATAGEYDIYYNTTAYVKGARKTGKYRWSGSRNGLQWNSGSSGCSEEKLVISDVPFKPGMVVVIYNSASYINNRVIAMHGMFANNPVNSSCQYHSKTSSSSSPIARTNIVSNGESYFSYDESTHTLTIKRPNSNYSWASNNYVVFYYR